MPDPTYRWYRELNRYQWFVLVVASLGWMLDCFDQQLFMMARQPAMTELLPEGSTRAEINESASYAVSVFLMGWGIGGLIFGVMGDRIGRAKTMMITILVYSIFTGLSAVSTSFWDFAIYRFLTGMGVGGEFAVGVALVAEVMPDRARPYTLALLQALSAVGNISAASTVARSGYFFQMFLPDPTQQGCTEAATVGGGPGTPAVDHSQAETLWCCYAWPQVQGNSGKRAFFINQSGDVLSSNNHNYNGTTTIPLFSDAFRVGTLARTCRQTWVASHGESVMKCCSAW